MRQPVQELIERYQKNLYAAAFNICKNQMDAEDVVQDGWCVNRDKYADPAEAWNDIGE